MLGLISNMQVLLWLCGEGWALGKAVQPCLAPQDVACRWPFSWRASPLSGYVQLSGNTPVPVNACSRAGSGPPGHTADGKPAATTYALSLSSNTRSKTAHSSKPWLEGSVCIAVLNV